MPPQPPAEQQGSKRTSQKAEQLLATTSMRLNATHSHNVALSGWSALLCDCCSAIRYVMWLSTVVCPGLCPVSVFPVPH